MISDSTSTTFYTEPLQFQAEQSRIWDKIAGGGSCRDGIQSWDCGEELARSPLLARDPEGALRAFHNVCRHRAGPLTWTGRPAEAQNHSV